MVGELVNLTMVELVGADHLRRSEQPPATITEAAIAGERGVLGEPAGDRRRRDTVPVARRDFACGIFKRVAAIIKRECFKDFREGIGLVADGAGAWRERATAGAATVERNILQLFLARALFDEAIAVAMGTASGRLDG